MQVAHYKTCSMCMLAVVLKKKNTGDHISVRLVLQLRLSEVHTFFLILRRFPFHCGNEFLPINVILVKVKGIIYHHAELVNLKIIIFFVSI